MNVPDPRSPVWTVYWTLKRALGSWIKPKDEHRPAVIADQVIADLKLSNWLLVKGLPGGGHGSSPEAITLLEERRHAFEQKLRELTELAEGNRPSDIKTEPGES
jgi:hypothetical protein